MQISKCCGSVLFPPNRIGGAEYGKVVVWWIVSVRPSSLVTNNRVFRVFVDNYSPSFKKADVVSKGKNYRLKQVRKQSRHQSPLRTWGFHKKVATKETWVRFWCSVYQQRGNDTTSLMKRFYWAASSSCQLTSLVCLTWMSLSTHALNHLKNEHISQILRFDLVPHKKR